MSEMMMIFIMIFSMGYLKAQYSASMLQPGQITEQHGINSRNNCAYW